MAVAVQEAAIAEAVVEAVAEQAAGASGAVPRPASLSPGR